MLQVSRSTTQRAKRVLDKGIPELIMAIDSGEVPVSAAVEVADLPPEVQAEAVALGPVGIISKASCMRIEREARRICSVPEVPPVIEGPPGFAKLWQDIDQFLRSLPRRGGIGELLRSCKREVISGSYHEMISLRETADQCVNELTEAFPWLTDQADD